MPHHPFDAATFRELVGDAFETLDVDRAREEVLALGGDPRALETWSTDFFRELIPRVELV